MSIGRRLTLISVDSKVGSSVGANLSCASTFSLSHSSNCLTSSAKSATCVSFNHGFFSGQDSISGLALAMNARAFSTIAGRLVCSAARNSIASPFFLSSACVFKKTSVAESAPSMYNQSSLSMSSSLNSERCSSVVTT